MANRAWRRCEARTETVGDEIAICPGCRSVAFRGVGDDPWVECHCGTRFNTNHVERLGTIGVVDDSDILHSKVVPYEKIKPHVEPQGSFR